ncbi:MAG: indole-3-glycerol phosphate synthase TrpC [Holophaga sp.]|nr:indole-3-glycerol phosphate synthase TrpC [Holophaga sp.]
MPESVLQSRLSDLPPARDFVASLANGHPSVIAEIKFRSPSMGDLRPDQDVENVARGYEKAGASALSVLVDAVHFSGELRFLGRAKSACSLPILAKGFFVDPYDLLEARVAGADAALLIACALSREELKNMLKTSREVGLATLMELHDEADLAKVEGLELDLVGVNHRNLATLAMDHELSASLAPKLPVARGRVAESGLNSAKDFLRMAALGYGAVLVGTAFMSQPDPGEGLARLLEECHACR